VSNIARTNADLLSNLAALPEPAPPRASGCERVRRTRLRRCPAAASHTMNVPITRVALHGSSAEKGNLRPRVECSHSHPLNAASSKPPAVSKAARCFVTPRGVSSRPLAVRLRISAYRPDAWRVGVECQGGSGAPAMRSNATAMRSNAPAMRQARLRGARTRLQGARTRRDGCRRCPARTEVVLDSLQMAPVRLSNSSAPPFERKSLVWVMASATMPAGIVGPLRAVRAGGAVPAQAGLLRVAHCDDHQDDLQSETPSASTEHRCAVGDLLAGQVVVVI
jgi:hypothetical protein